MGDGPSRSTLVAEPANLTTDPVASYTDGQLFLAIRMGKMVGGRFTMPPVERMNDEEDVLKGIKKNEIKLVIY
ncbi:MAG: hypothetical protein EBZ36_07680, partial [Acidobacteria bacterium]|nr:hypothetical protein [Acidobacteriota bacterium]